MEILLVSLVLFILHLVGSKANAKKVSSEENI